jgi:purine-binding chemotaxis protein CheW
VETRGELSPGEERSPVEALLVFRVRDYRFAVHVQTVEKVVSSLEISALPGAPDAVAGVFNFHGTVIPVLDLNLRIDGQAAKPSLDAQLLIVRTPARQLAILADEVLDIVAIPADKIVSRKALVPGVGLVSGVAAAPDGLIFIQDADSFLMQAEEMRLASLLSKAHA